MKTCRTCGVEKPLTAFYRNKRHADGHANYCAECKREKARARYVALPGPKPAKGRVSYGD